ncbi:MAG: ECF-type sigma factor [Candidatus Eisenbacteria bacterium]
MNEGARSTEAVLTEFVRGVALRATVKDTSNLDSLLPLVYEELRVLATYLLRSERDAATLRPTALAHEAYLRLAGQTRFVPKNSGHLLAVASTLMRRVLVDYAREKRAAKRGGGAIRVTLSHEVEDTSARPVDLLALDDALEALEEMDERKARVVEMLYFSGFTLAETATALDVSVKTVQRDWEFARAWLYRRISPE